MPASDSSRTTFTAMSPSMYSAVSLGVAPSGYVYVKRARVSRLSRMSRRGRVAVAEMLLRSFFLRADRERPPARLGDELLFDTMRLNCIPRWAVVPGTADSRAAEPAIGGSPCR